MALACLLGHPRAARPQDHPTWDIHTLRCEIQAVQRELSDHVDLDSRFASYCGLDKVVPTVPPRTSLGASAA